MRVRHAATVVDSCAPGDDHKEPEKQRSREQIPDDQLCAAVPHHSPSPPWESMLTFLHLRRLSHASWARASRARWLRGRRSAGLTSTSSLSSPCDAGALLCLGTFSSRSTNTVFPRHVCPVTLASLNTSPRGTIFSTARRSLLAICVAGP